MAETISLTIAGDASQLGAEFRKADRKANNAAKGISDSMGKAMRRVEKDAKRASTTLRERFTSAARSVGNAAAATANGLGSVAAAAIAAGAAMKALGDNTFGTVDEMNTMAQASGLSIETINGLRRAALNANKDLSEIMPKDLAKRIFETSIGTGEAVLAFEALDIAVVESNGSLRQADDVLVEALDKLQRIEDPTTRAAVSVKLLGEEGKNMLSAFDNSEGLRDAVAQADHFGIRAGPAAVDASNAWWKATSNVTVALEDGGQALVDAFGPQATKFMNDLSVGMIYVTTLAGQWAKGLSQVGRMWAAIWAQDFDEASLRSKMAMQDFEFGFTLAEEKARLFWETNLAGSDAAAPELERHSDQLETIEIDYANVMNAAELYNQTVRGKLVPSQEAALDGATAYTEGAGEALEELNEGLSSHADAWEPVLDTIDEVEDKTKETAMGLLDMFDKLGSAIMTFNQLAVDATVEAARAAMDEARASGQFTEAQLAELEAQQQARIDREFRRGQDLQRVLAIVDAARAAVSLIPSFAFLGPGAPFAAAGVAAAGLAAQLAIINAQQPPSFPTGGVMSTGGAMAGHSLAYIDPGEGIASRRAMSMPGFAEALEAANRGFEERMSRPTTVGVLVSYDRGAQRLKVVPDRRVGKRPRIRGGG